MNEAPLLEGLVKKTVELCSMSTLAAKGAAKMGHPDLLLSPQNAREDLIDVAELAVVVEGFG